MDEQPSSARVYVIRVPESRLNTAICERYRVSPEQLLKNQLRPIITKSDSAQQSQKAKAAEIIIDLDS